jgi:hypothetical protein
LRERLRVKEAALEKKWRKSQDAQREEIRALQQHINEQAELHNMQAMQYAKYIEAEMRKKEDAMQSAFREAVEQESQRGREAMEQQLRQREEQMKQSLEDQLKRAAVSRVRW